MEIRKFITLSVVLFLSSVLGGCKVTTFKEAPEPSAQEEAPPVEPELATQSAPLSKIQLELLKMAEDDFRNARFTTPSHNNAYDKYQSVLLVDPDNPRARTGLQAILLHYAGLIRDNVKVGQYPQARHWLAVAQEYYADNALLSDLKAHIQQAQQAAFERRQKAAAAAEAARLTALAAANPADDPNALGAHAATPTPAPVVLDYEDIELAPQALSDKDESIIATLADLALRIKDRDESILIFARTDAEGRWIYKQLKQATPGYRIRGDIRRAAEPKVRILPPY